MTTYLPIILFLIILLWLSNREMRKSLEQAKISEKIMEKEHQDLKIIIEKNIKELKENRLARINELSTAAEFGRLSQGLFHDLITPLTSLMLHTEKLKSEKMQEISTIYKNIEKVTEVSNRMSSYVKDIRKTLSREESDKICILSEELAHIIQLVSRMAVDRNIEISIIKNEYCAWYGNPVKIRQIFLNLISNAIDSFEETNQYENDKKRIEISIENVLDKIMIKVKDNGSGIKKDDIRKIYEPFFTTKSIDKGTGIGLTTVKSIVEEELKGEIEVLSQTTGEERGTIFTIYLTKR
ncbi:MAG TPA: HAMP domain-containing sensor histidine kinase [Candidatus Paceibacterota bacterium]